MSVILDTGLECKDAEWSARAIQFFFDFMCAKDYDLTTFEKAGFRTSYFSVTRIDVCPYQTVEHNGSNTGFIEALICLGDMA